MELPEKPLDSDCCGSGCTPCVFDVYEELLAKWKVSSKTSNIAPEKLRLRTDLLSVLKYKPYKLLEIETVTENANIYTFIPLLTEEDEDKEEAGQAEEKTMVNEIEGILPYEPGQHFVLINCKPDKHTTNEQKTKLSRCYTPISVAQNEPNCRVRFLIKLYENGAMSRHISRLNINHVMYMRGAFGDFRHHRRRPPGDDSAAYIFICAGTGIAPVYAIVKSILQDDSDETTIRLLFTCRTLNEIYFRNEIREFCKFWNFTARIYVSDKETGLAGVKHDEDIQFARISKEIIFNEVSSRCLNNCKVLICGSSSFNEDIASYARQSGVSEDNLFVF
ncbi:NADH-cytochrome b5 reductase-like isoform X1 [Planococcus citri]|uniref:NADH-cytochrome b5 reductase-like isoform X1 n=1 Tax=Planococcus citri TaxID=170843 RepID=UPI0031FA2B01